MSRLLPVYSQRTFLLDALNALALRAKAATTTVPNHLIEDCLVSLTLEEMCHVVQVQGRAGYRQPSSVLDQALDAIEGKLYQPDGALWSPYWQQVRETLKYPATQLESLQARLITTQQQEGLLEQQSVDAGVEVPFEVLHLPELEVLVAIPLQKGCYLDLDRVQAQAGWLVAGDYYPFEIHSEEFTFIVSATGEVVVSIQHFPDFLVRQVREQLRLVAQTLYTTRRPRFTARVEEPDALEHSSLDEGE